jgi:hypothetical protein
MLPAGILEEEDLLSSASRLPATNNIVGAFYHEL